MIQNFFNQEKKSKTLHHQTICCICNDMNDQSNTEQSRFFEK